MSPTVIAGLVLGWGMAAALGVALFLRTRSRPLAAGPAVAAGDMARLRHMLDPVAAECYLAGLDGSLVYANRAAANSLGYTVEELLAVGMRGIDPDYDRRLTEQAGALRQHGLPAAGTVHIAKGGRRISKQVASVVLRVDGQDYVCTVGYDISERSQAEQQDRDLAERARQTERLEALATLAGNVAHDFSSVLTAVLGNLGMALDDLPADAPARPFLVEAAAAGRRASHLTHQMLAFSGRGRLRFSSLDVGQLLTASATRLFSLVPENVVLKVDAAPGLPSVKADAAQLQQVLVDLVTNARDAIGVRSGEITVSASRRDFTTEQLGNCLGTHPLSPGEYVVLAVADTGCGMSQEVVDHAVEPFFSHKRGGRGLGLPMVLGIAKGFHGGMVLETVEGKGTTVSILLPVQVDVVATPGVPGDAPVAPAVRSRGVMLVVDDDESVRTLTARMAVRMGYEVLTAADGVEAVEVFSRRAADMTCVVLDVLMPRMDGVATFAALRKLRPEIRVVLCSGFSDPERTQRMVVSGARGFLPKPFSYAQFLEAIEKAIGDTSSPS